MKGKMFFTFRKCVLRKSRHRNQTWLSGEALQIAEKRKDMKGKGEKERYTHLNAAFQRTARRDKTAFLSDQCKKKKKKNTGKH